MSYQLARTLTALKNLEHAASMAALADNSDANPQAVALRTALAEARAVIAKADRHVARLAMYSPSVSTDPAVLQRPLGEKADINAYYYRAALAAGMTAKDVALVARANHLDNFITWIAGTLNYAIVAAFVEDVPAHVAWFNAFCKSSPLDHKPLIRAVAIEIYDHFNSFVKV